MSSLTGIFWRHFCPYEEYLQRCFVAALIDMTYISFVAGRLETSMFVLKIKKRFITIKQI